MNKYILLLILITTLQCSYSQNIHSALHLNDKEVFKLKIPKKIVETNTFFGTSGPKEVKNIKTFDSLGLLVEEQRFDEQGKLEVRLVCAYDPIHKLISSTNFERWMSWGYTKEITIYSYDTLCFLKAIKTMDDLGNVSFQSSVVCNERGDPIELSIWDSNGNSYGKETATYDYTQNQYIDAVFAIDGKVLSSDTHQIRKIIRADENSNRWESKSLNGSVRIYEESFRYDTYGNCTEQLIFEIVTHANGKSKKKKDRIFRKEYFY